MILQQIFKATDSKHLYVDSHSAVFIYLTFTVPRKMNQQIAPHSKYSASAVHFTMGKIAHGYGGKKESHVKSSHWRCSVRKGVLRNFAKIHRKTPVPESFFK